MQSKRIKVSVSNNDTFYQIWQKTIEQAHQDGITGLSKSMAADIIRDQCGYIYTSDYLPWHMGPESISMMILDPGGICDGLTKFTEIYRVILDWYYDTYDKIKEDGSTYISPGLLEQNFAYSVVPGICLACNYQGYSMD